MATNGISPDTLDKIYEKGAATAPTIERPDGGREVLLPDGYTTHTIPPLEKLLPRIRQNVALNDISSFVGYVNRYKSDATRLFAVPGHIAGDKKSSVTAILDYHTPGHADHGAHVVRYLPRYSEQWERWTKAAPMAQAAFAEFIEENRPDIVQPDAAFLLDIVTKFKASRKQDFNSVVYQPNGDVTIAWTEQTENAGSKPGVAVPQQLELGIPVFFKGTVYSVPVFMRYRLAEGKLTFVIKADRPEYVEQAAFDEITKAITEATGIEIYLGVAS